MKFNVKHIDLNEKIISDISKVVLPKDLSLTIYQIIKMEVPA